MEEIVKGDLVTRLQAVKQKSGKSYNQLADETGLTNVYVAQLLRRQAQLKPDTAPKLRAALPGLPEEFVLEMMKPPLRSYDPNLIQDPTVCRLNEAVMHFGESIKEIINEEFGDGIRLCILDVLKKSSALRTRLELMREAVIGSRQSYWVQTNMWVSRCLIGLRFGEFILEGEKGKAAEVAGERTVEVSYID